MNKNFMEKRLINNCASILGISNLDVAKMFAINKDTNNFIKRRIFFGFNNVEDNIGFMLKGLLCRDKEDFSPIKEEEIQYIKKYYNININNTFMNKPLVLSEKKDPLILGISGEIILREFAKVLGITRNDASKLIKGNKIIKDFMLKEDSLSLLNKRSCISVLLQNILGRGKNDFSAISKSEIAYIYNKYGICIGNINNINKTISSRVITG